MKITQLYMSHFMTKPAFAICEQQRRRSACASAQSDQRLCCSLPGYYNTSTCYNWNFKPLASLCSWAGPFESYLVANPEGRFSHEEAHIILTSSKIPDSIKNLMILLYHHNTVRPFCGKCERGRSIQDFWTGGSNLILYRGVWFDCFTHFFPDFPMSRK